MSHRAPRHHPLANSQAPFALLINRQGRIRTIEVHPAVATGAGIAGGLLVAWLVLASLYLVFKDDLVARIFNQQTQMQYGYEDRIAALRNEVDRLASRGLVDQDTVEAKLGQLLARQVKLDTRQAMLAPLLDHVPAPAAHPATARPAAPGSAGASFSPYEPGKSDRPTPVDGDGRLGDLIPPGTPVFAPSARNPEAVRRTAAEVDASLSRIENNQDQALDALQKQASRNLHHWREIIQATGLPVRRFEKQEKAEKDVGGPYVPLPGDARFQDKVARTQFTLEQAAALRKVVADLPLMRPMPADHTITSPFGARPDPFFHRYAMHTGIDFRAVTGTPVPATAPGKVVEAGPMGGYGNMIEIDHGNGIHTRYGHLSKIEVEVGETVRKGETIGLVGTTGRSTGPHLHYEVRIDGEAVDPMRFIRPGALVASR